LGIPYDYGNLHIVIIYVKLSTLANFGALLSCSLGISGISREKSTFLEMISVLRGSFARSGNDYIIHKEIVQGTLGSTPALRVYGTKIIMLLF
jgi:hypothetical protein